MQFGGRSINITSLLIQARLICTTREAIMAALVVHIGGGGVVGAGFMSIMDAGLLTSHDRL